MNNGSVSISIYATPARSAVQNNVHEDVRIVAKNRLPMIAVLNHQNVWRLINRSRSVVSLIVMLSPIHRCERGARMTLLAKLLMGYSLRSSHDVGAKGLRFLFAEVGDYYI